MLDNLAKKAGIVPAQGSTDGEGAYLQSGFEIVVTCSDEDDQRKLYEQLAGEGRKCRVLTF